MAMSNLGFLCEKGQGVPQSYERAAELFKQSAAQGEPVSQRDQAQFHMQILQIFSFEIRLYEWKNAFLLQAIPPHQAY